MKTAPSFAYESKSIYSVRIRSTDAGGLSFEKGFTIGITDVGDLDRIAVGFCSTLRTWFWKQPGTWTLLDNYTPVWIVTGDLDANGKVDLVVNFGGTTGIWIYRDTGTWQWLHSLASSTAAMGDLNADGRDELILSTSSAGVAGLWSYYPATSPWRYISGWQAESLAVGDFDGGGKQEVAADFGTNGLLFYNNDATWQWKHSYNATWMAAGDTVGNGKPAAARVTELAGLTVTDDASPKQPIHAC